MDNGAALSLWEGVLAAGWQRGSGCVLLEWQCTLALVAGAWEACQVAGDDNVGAVQVSDRDGAVLVRQRKCLGARWRGKW